MEPIDFSIVVWVALSLVFCRDGWLEVKDARDALAYLLANKINGSRRAMARTHLRTANKLLGNAILFVVVGITSWLANHTMSPFSTIAGFAFSVAMFAVLIWALVVTRIDRHERLRLVKSLYEDHG